MRGMAKNDKEHTHLPVTDNTGTDDGVDNYPLTEAVWIETEMPQAEYNLEEDEFPLVGTELANFLNFDIDCFMNGLPIAMGSRRRGQGKPYCRLEENRGV